MDKIIIDFSEAGSQSRWEVVNDSVMGGLSQSSLTVSGGKNAIFQGLVSLENNGGFASVRTSPGNYRLEEYDGLVIRVRGDGNRYRVRLRTDENFDGIAYQAGFATLPHEWMTVRLPFSGFIPVFRGRVVSDAPALSRSSIRRIGFMIADKQKGPFLLEIEWIKAYKR